jgi:hypothetical protein
LTRQDYANDRKSQLKPKRELPVLAPAADAIGIAGEFTLSTYTVEKLVDGAR